MSRRKENVRKALAEIDEFVDAVNTQIKNGNLQLAIFTLSGIKVRTHRIKRTTWRGDVLSARDKEIIRKNLFPSLPKPSAKKEKWNKDWAKYNNTKRTNINTTTTANIDVSTIPYY